MLKMIIRYALCVALIILPAFNANANAADHDDDNGEARFLTQTRQLIADGKRSGEGYFSPDGQSLIYQSERDPNNPFYQIYTLDFQSGETKLVSPGIGKTTCAFFRPGSNDILFSSTHLDPGAAQKEQEELAARASGKSRRYAWDYDDQMDVFTAKRDGSELKRLTTAEGYDAEGNYSPDGKKIVFTSLRDAYPIEKLTPEDRKQFENNPSYFGEIYIMDADGSNQRRLTFSPGYDGGPFFSPDGQRIVWRHFSDDEHADIYTMKLDGTDVRRITDFGVMSWSPYYHPSGRYMIFSSNKLGFSNFELYIVDTEGTREPVRVTFTDGFDGLPVFSPDGTKLSWTSSRTPDGKSQIFIADWNHAAALAALEQAPARINNSLIPPPPAPPAIGLIHADDLKKHVYALADDKMEGRMTGSPGAALAADYITAQLTAIGLQPLPGQTSFLQPFEFSAGVHLAQQGNAFKARMSFFHRKTFKSDVDFRPLAFSDNGSVEGDVVFAGYGLSVPASNAGDKQNAGYDSYANLDVKDKIVMVLRYVPENVSPERRAELNRYASLRYKAAIARNHGAKALLVVSGPHSANAGELIPLTGDNSLSGSGIVAASMSIDAANVLLSHQDKTIEQLQTALDDENAQNAGLDLDVSVKLSTALEHEKKTDNNIVAWLPPANSDDHEYVMLGAHYDHLGHGEAGNGLADKSEAGEIYNGADDNASGDATVIEIARALVAERKANPEQFKRGVVFAFWSGEELGLIGSSHYVETPALPLADDVAYINFDMVGRLRDNKLMLEGTGSSSAWRKLIEKNNANVGLSLVLQDDPYLPTDSTSFYTKNVPTIAFFTGSHENYHRPTDKADTLNYAGMERVARFAKSIALDLATTTERPDYVKAENTQSAGGGRDALRVYLGTIPDYASETQGLKLTGVRGGSPADKAGLQAGDIIIEFAGQKIANIYDYTYALDAVKIGVPVKVVAMRNVNGKDTRVEFTVTPEARK